MTAPEFVVDEDETTTCFGGFLGSAQEGAQAEVAPAAVPTYSRDPSPTSISRQFAAPSEDLPRLPRRPPYTHEANRRTMGGFVTQGVYQQKPRTRDPSPVARIDCGHGRTSSASSQGGRLPMKVQTHRPKYNAARVRDAYNPHWSASGPQAAAWHFPGLGACSPSTGKPGLGCSPSIGCIGTADLLTFEDRIDYCVETEPCAFSQKQPAATAQLSSAHSVEQLQVPEADDGKSRDYCQPTVKIRNCNRYMQDCLDPPIDLDDSAHHRPEHGLQSYNLASLAASPEAHSKFGPDVLKYAGRNYA